MENAEVSFPNVRGLLQKLERSEDESYKGANSDKDRVNSSECSKFLHSKELQESGKHSLKKVKTKPSRRISLDCHDQVHSNAAQNTSDLSDSSSKTHRLSRKVSVPVMKLQNNYMERCAKANNQVTAVSTDYGKEIHRRLSVGKVSEVQNQASSSSPRSKKKHDSQLSNALGLATPQRELRRFQYSASKETTQASRDQLVASNVLEKEYRNERSVFRNKIASSISESQHTEKEDEIKNEAIDVQNQVDMLVRKALDAETKSACGNGKIDSFTKSKEKCHTSPDSSGVESNAPVQNREKLQDRPHPNDSLSKSLHQREVSKRRKGNVKKCEHKVDPVLSDTHENDTCSSETIKGPEQGNTPKLLDTWRQILEEMSLKSDLKERSSGKESRSIIPRRKICERALLFENAAENGVQEKSGTESFSGTPCSEKSRSRDQSPSLKSINRDMEKSEKPSMARGEKKKSKAKSTLTKDDIISALMKETRNTSDQSNAHSASSQHDSNVTEQQTEFSKRKSQKSKNKTAGQSSSNLHRKGFDSDGQSSGQKNENYWENNDFIKKYWGIKPTQQKHQSKRTDNESSKQSDQISLRTNEEPEKTKECLEYQNVSDMVSKNEASALSKSIVKDEAVNDVSETVEEETAKVDLSQFKTKLYGRFEDVSQSKQQHQQSNLHVQNSFVKENDLEHRKSRKDLPYSEIQMKEKTKQKVKKGLATDFTKTQPLPETTKAAKESAKTILQSKKTASKDNGDKNQNSDKLSALETQSSACKDTPTTIVRDKSSQIEEEASQDKKAQEEAEWLQNNASIEERKRKYLESVQSLQTESKESFEPFRRSHSVRGGGFKNQKVLRRHQTMKEEKGDRKRKKRASWSSENNFVTAPQNIEERKVKQISWKLEKEESVTKQGIKQRRLTPWSLEREDSTIKKYLEEGKTKQSSRDSEKRDLLMKEGVVVEKMSPTSRECEEENSPIKQHAQEIRRKQTPWMSWKECCIMNQDVGNQTSFNTEREKGLTKQGSNIRKRKQTQWSSEKERSNKEGDPEKYSKESSKFPLKSEIPIETVGNKVKIRSTKEEADNQMYQHIKQLKIQTDEKSPEVLVYDVGTEVQSPKSNRDINDKLLSNEMNNIYDSENTLKDQQTENGFINESSKPVKIFSSKAEFDRKFFEDVRNQKSEGRSHSFSDIFLENKKNVVITGSLTDLRTSGRKTNDRLDSKKEDKVSGLIKFKIMDYNRSFSCPRENKRERETSSQVLLASCSLQDLGDVVADKEIKAKTQPFYVANVTQVAKKGGKTNNQSVKSADILPLKDQTIKSKIKEKNDNTEINEQNSKENRDKNRLENIRKKLPPLEVDIRPKYQDMEEKTKIITESREEKSDGNEEMQTSKNNQVLSIIGTAQLDSPSLSPKRISPNSSPTRISSPLQKEPSLQRNLAQTQKFQKETLKTTHCSDQVNSVYTKKEKEESNVSTKTSPKAISIQKSGQAIQAPKLNETSTKQFENKKLNSPGNLSAASGNTPEKTSPISLRASRQRQSVSIHSSEKTNSIMPKRVKPPHSDTENLTFTSESSNTKPKDSEKNRVEKVQEEAVIPIQELADKECTQSVNDTKVAKRKTTPASLPKSGFSISKRSVRIVDENEEKEAPSKVLDSESANPVLSKKLTGKENGQKGMLSKESLEIETNSKTYKNICYKEPKKENQGFSKNPGDASDASSGQVSSENSNQKISKEIQKSKNVSPIQSDEKLQLERITGNPSLSPCTDTPHEKSKEAPTCQQVQKDVNSMLSAESQLKKRKAGSSSPVTCKELQSEKSKQRTLVQVQPHKNENLSLSMKGSSPVEMIQNESQVSAVESPTQVKSSKIESSILSNRRPKSVKTSGKANHLQSVESSQLVKETENTSKAPLVKTPVALISSENASPVISKTNPTNLQEAEKESPAASVESPTPVARSRNASPLPSGNNKTQGEISESALMDNPTFPAKTAKPRSTKPDSTALDMTIVENAIPASPTPSQRSGQTTLSEPGKAGPIPMQRTGKASSVPVPKPRNRVAVPLERTTSLGVKEDSVLPVSEEYRPSAPALGEHPVPPPRRLPKK